MDKIKNRTNEERIDLMNKVDALRKSGMTLSDACSKVGITRPSYANWRFLFGKGKKYKKKTKPKVEMLSMPMQTASGRAYLVVGSVRDITDILNGVN